MKQKETREDLIFENKTLKSRLEEADEMLRAIRKHEIDAVIVEGSDGLQVFTLQGADQSYKIFVETMSEGAVTISPDGLILHSNMQFAALMGRSLGKVIGKSLYELVEPKNQELEKMLRACPPEGCRGEFSLRKSKGGSIPIHISARPAMLETEVLCVVVTDLSVQDGMQKTLQAEIRRRHKAEEELRASHAQLEEAYEKLVKETKDKESLEDRLRQAQKMESLGTLTGGIAHDFNNILAAILGFAEMSLDDAPKNSQQEKNLKHVITSCFRGRDLIQQMLAFSRKTDAVRKPLSLSPLISETVKLLRASLPSTIELEFQKKAAFDMVNANPTEIQQVIMNLCTNAAQALPEGQGRVKISLGNVMIDSIANDRPELTGGRYLTIEVKDTGIGMDTAVIKRIFEPFYTTKETGKGTGMGLAVVYGIVKGLGGDINVESRPGIGTTFQILLPVVESGLKQANIGTSGPSGHERILFIDDDELLAELGKGMLERLGYKVEAMTDSLNALDLFLKDPNAFDLVFTDQTMPRMTGLKLAQEMLKVRPNIPILLYTGHSDAVSIEVIEKIGIKGSLMKPLTKQEAAKAIRRLLDEKKDSQA
jgi:PAS domain S-box-containing protein